MSIISKVTSRYLKRASWSSIDPITGKSVEPPVNKGLLINAIPGVDPANEGFYIGDESWDLTARLCDTLDALYLKRWGRLPKLEEIYWVFRAGYKLWMSKHGFLK
jgi:hypothetical protein